MGWLRGIPFFNDFFIPFLDIAALTFLVYSGYKILVQTRAIQLIRGTMMLFIVYGIAFILELRTLLTVLNLMAPGLIIGLSIIFQPELRKIVTQIGQGNLLLSGNRKQNVQLSAILECAEALSQQKRGALIVIVRKIGLKNMIEKGTILEAQISYELLMSIFAYDTALHDGAVIIDESKILAAGVVLPLSDQTTQVSGFGTRHRAALGISEETDALALIVSEETGAISIAMEGVIYYNLDRAELVELLQESLKDTYLASEDLGNLDSGVGKRGRKGGASGKN